MCGMAGILFWDNTQPTDIQLNNMVDALFHRGPDGNDTFIQGSVGLAHTRLSIIDTSDAGKQPMSDGHLTITYNGEIFNYKEIKLELENMGVRFSSTSDTEVILKAYSMWGTDCFAKFNGMWALAIWNNKTKQLVLSRDRFGVKPLYYGFFNGGFVFASEAKAIFSTDLIKCQPNWSWWHQYLSVGYIDTGEETFFENIKMFPKANFAIVSESLKFEKYWSFDYKNFRSKYDYENPEQQLKDILQDSISLRLRSDVPIGSCLSGGMDSRSIVCMAASENKNNNFHTFSAFYTEEGYNEKEFAEEVNLKTGAIPHYLNPVPSEAMMFSIIGAYHTERPCSGPTLITQLNVMREVHKHVKVVLDGQGVDEYLCGYHSFYLSYLNSMATKAKKGLLYKVNYWKALFSLMSSNHSRESVYSYFLLKLPSPVKKLLSLLRNSPNHKPIIHDSFQAQYTDNASIPKFEAPYEEELNNVLYNQFFYQSIPALLMLEDANSMAFSVEARLPFMDYRMVEFIFGLEMEKKISGWKTKAILRDALKGILPDKILNRKDKKGYPTPYAHWLRTAIKSDVEKIIFSTEAEKRKLFNIESIRHYWDQHQTANFDFSWIIYKVLSTELWFRIFIDKTLTAPSLNRHKIKNDGKKVQDGIKAEAMAFS